MTAVAKIHKLNGASALDAAVDRALKMIAACQRPTFGDARDEKLSAKAYLDQALENAGSTIEKVRGLRANLDADLEKYTYGGAIRGEACKRSAATRADQGADLDPSRNPLALLGGNIEALTLAHVDCLQLGCNVLELIAVGVLDAVEQYPDAFGLIESRAEEKRKAEEIAAAVAAIDASWTLDETRWLMIDEAKGIGRLVLAYRGEVTDVSAMPREGSGARLVGWISAQE